ncbi:MAG: hypothetical protein K1X64_22350 [Myxococcaceae bacterium]|nr:hypothetical protein [Myxococcaceae bacterium]
MSSATPVFIPYHPLRWRLLFFAGAGLSVLLVAQALQGARDGSEPLGWVRASVVGLLMLAMLYVVFRLRPRAGWGVTFSGTAMTVARPFGGELALPYSAIKSARRRGKNRDALILTTSNEQILLPAHLFANRQVFESLVTAVDEHLPVHSQQQ